MALKVVCISDTHGSERLVELPEGDLLIHAGDWTIFGNVQQLNKFAMWVEEIAPNYPAGVVLIAGNHDIGMDPTMAQGLFNYNEHMFRNIKNVYYLNDQGCEITHEGKVYKVWGSPITPVFWDWAFNRKRGPYIKEHWDLIPEDTNILVTHGPPKGIRDSSLGCNDLLNKVTQLKELKLHVFGHIHPPYGITKLHNRLYVNAAQCEIIQGNYVIQNKPIVIEI